MDAAWIKVIVLTLAECVAPEGKTVCREQEVQYHFLDEVECQKVLEQLLDYRDGFDNVIVNREDSSCLPAAKIRRYLIPGPRRISSLREPRDGGSCPTNRHRRTSCRIDTTSVYKTCPSVTMRI